MIKRRFIILDELEKKCSACSQLVLIVKSLYNVE